MFRTVIFDMDDTLIKTREAKFAAHKFTAKKFYDLDFTDEHLSSHWGKPFERMLVDMYGQIDTFDNLFANYRTITTRYPVSAYDGAVECLIRLKERYHLGLLTAANCELTMQALRDAGIKKSWFAYLQTADDTELHKPDPGVFAPILEHFGRLGIDKSEILYIGDKLDDLVSSRKAGIEFIAVADHTTPASSFNSAGARHVDSFDRLLTLLP